MSEGEEKKKRESGVWTYYKIEGDKLIRRLPFCERCGPGRFMADHGDRYVCGYCGYTIYKRAGEGSGGESRK